ncbi:uncharacterized protein LOC119683853 [Teleopsis dalmanni]|uniref:uncharacterized protein LOC119683853 n=1 Tax=Teleopsis dalmanni TaxID=139649 RepID=UPI0018CF8906|nr:uncharacterized protein LOC119683853 [Teleopsis dalmanni]
MGEAEKARCYPPLICHIQKAFLWLLMLVLRIGYGLIRIVLRFVVVLVISNIIAYFIFSSIEEEQRTQQPKQVKPAVIQAVSSRLEVRIALPQAPPQKQQRTAQQYRSPGPQPNLNTGIRPDPTNEDVDSWEEKAVIPDEGED